ncbi:hypothetical protein BIY26_08975 [Brenneria goodwinii]|uniref:Uncharacterized protein n=1 Tax=Brenneria goodwinii TaxID=1109412 RepID=A0AAE8JN78_9GAMM|nr:hypothetical protein [Brenneria goodwinii]ATA26594.1 hypothetical protein AWC36_22190 [Brenneria goodwinii]RLM25392.1 hypothetical protein BIY26_08975 [Brenneria goodwinii]
MLSSTKKRMATLANDPDHLPRLMVMWPENHIIHQLAKALLDVKTKKDCPALSPINEQEAFELWFASDYSPDKSSAASDESEAFFKAIFWHVWQARAQLDTQQGE